MNKDEINIIFLGESYLGGMAGSKRIQNIINPFLKMGDVTISNLIIANPNETIDADFYGTKNKVKYRIINFTTNPLSFFNFYYSGFKFIAASKINESRNILYCYDNPTAFNFLFILFAKSKKMKIVVDMVEDYNLLDKKKLLFTQKIKIFIQNILLNNLNLYTDAVIVISEYLKNFTEKIVKKKAPVYYLPIMVDKLQILPSIKESNGLKIFYGGSFGEKDGVICLLKAFEKVSCKFPNAQMILTGRPAKAGMHEVLQYIENSGVKEKIKFLGYLNDSEYYSTMSNCDIFCATRINSNYANAGFPFKLGEMLATGKPVVTTYIGDIPKYLENKKNAIMVEPGSVDEIANGLIFLIENPERAAEIGEEGKKVVLEFFNATIEVEKLKLFLLEI